MNRALKALLVAAAVSGSAASPALAAPDHTGTVSGAAPVFAWDGAEVVFSFAPYFDPPACTSALPAGRYCEQVLVEVKDAGKTTFEIDPTGDLDIFLYASDSAGTASGDELGQGIGEGVVKEKITITAQPGFYLLYVNYYDALEAGYKGKITGAAVAPVAPADAPPAGSTTPPPNTPPASTEQPQPTSQPAQPAAPPALTASATLGSAKIKGILSGGVPVNVSCSIACKGTITLTAKIGGKKVMLGKATISNPGGQQAVKVKLSKKAKKALKKAKKAKVSLKGTITDSSGGQAKSFSASATFKK